jgi:hypothetical protein
VAETKPNEATVTIGPIARSSFKRARLHAARFVRKSTPSRLEPDEPAEFTGRGGQDSPALRYGRWWHHVLERLDWRSGREAAQAVFDAQLATAPDPAAAAMDWSASRDALFDDSAIAQFIARPEAIHHREFPFSWRLHEQAALEGFIDLLLIDLAAEECLLLDWKTNRASAADAEALRARYRPQLAGYWKAISTLTGFNTTAAVFSTALGRLLPYGTAEVEAEWARLEKLPPQQLEEELRPDPDEDV